MILYYAPGGGLGHITRGIAILREWQRLGAGPCRLLTYSPFAHLAEQEGIPVERMSAAGAGSLATALERCAPRLLVVDTFPRGIVAEIAESAAAIPCPLVLVQRYLHPDYIARFNVADFVQQNYALAVRIGDTLPPQNLTSRTVDVPPVTIRRADEITPSAGRAGWVFVSWGPESEPYAEAAAEAARTAQQTLTVLSPLTCYPAIQAIAAAELAIGSGGYNFFHETALAGTAAIFVPVKKMYDDQFGRTAGRPQAHTPTELYEFLLKVRARPAPAAAAPAGGASAGAVAGATAAVETIRDFLRVPAKAARD